MDGSLDGWIARAACGLLCDRALTDLFLLFTDERFVDVCCAGRRVVADQGI